MGSIPGSGRSPGEGTGNPLQYSCLENPMDRGAWWSAVHRVTKSWTQLKRLSMHEAEIVTLTSLVLCITSEPLGRCPSISRTPECPGQVKHSRRVWAPWSLLRGSRGSQEGSQGRAFLLLPCTRSACTSMGRGSWLAWPEGLQCVTQKKRRGGTRNTAEPHSEGGEEASMAWVAVRCQPRFSFQEAASLELAWASPS